MARLSEFQPEVFDFPDKTLINSHVLQSKVRAGLAEISELAAPHDTGKVCNECDHAVLQATDF